MLFCLRAGRFYGFPFLKRHILGSMSCSDRDTKRFLQDGLLVQHPKVQVGNCEALKFLAQPGGINHFHHGLVDLFIPIQRGFVIRDFPSLFNAHVIAVDIDVLCQQRIIIRVI